MVTWHKDEAITLDDVLIRPAYSDLPSRLAADTLFELKYGNKSWKINPIIVANMIDLTTPAMVEAMYYERIIVPVHRNQPVEGQLEALQFVLSKGDRIVPAAASVGLNDRERAYELVNAGVDILFLELAHAHTKQAIDELKYLKGAFPETMIVVGNIATKEAVEDLTTSAGINWIKCGVGSGCACAGTNILMADGSYRAIEKLRIHDRIIGKSGKPVNVVGIRFSGYKNVIKYRHNIFPGFSVFTPDHKHWIGSYAGTSDINKVSITKVLDKLTKTTPRKSKYYWDEIGKTEDSVLLTPKNIQFDFPKDFVFNMLEFANADRGFKPKHKLIYKDLYPSYELGYAIGTFLGDGSASIIHNTRTTKDGRNIKNTVAHTHWYFGINESKIAKKLSKCLYNLFGIKPLIKKKKNIILVNSRSNVIARFFYQFGKRTKKDIPNKYWCGNKDYIKGLYDGLLDSDGSYCADGRIAFGNTSKKLIKRFMILFYSVNGYFPSCTTKKPSIGNLKDCKLENCKKSYVCRSINNPKHSLTNKYQISRILEKETVSIIVPTYDIQVDDEEQAFIANNVIVHNSVCTTRLVTGCGVSQLSAVMECVNQNLAHIISDGGTRHSGDCMKVLAAGAKLVMIGSLFAGTDESNTEHVYNGMSSKEAGKVREGIVPEGISTHVPYKGSAKKVAKELIAGIRQGMAMIGAKNLDDIPKKAVFQRVSQATITENGPHILLRR